MIYGGPAANTQYVGIALWRAFEQIVGSSLNNNLDTMCIGHSLGSHACAFFSNAMEKKTGTKLKSIIAMDPAGPLFYTGIRGII